MLVDTHCHLNFNLFDNDRAAVLERARLGEVERILVPAIDLPTSRAVVSLAAAHAGVLAAVGVHPNDALTWDEQALPELTTLASLPQVVAIGEIGLDYYWERAPDEVQAGILWQQLGLAQQQERPVVLHARDVQKGPPRVMGDLLDILREWVQGLAQAGSPLTSRPGVLHSFSGTLQEARQAIELGFYIGITGPVTFKKATSLQNLVAELPLERVLIETDAPFLTPHPYRGQRNEPAYVRFVAEKIAQIHQRSIEEIMTITTGNARRLLGW